MTKFNIQIRKQRQKSKLLPKITILVILLLIMILGLNVAWVYAEEENGDYVGDLYHSTYEQIDNLDLDKLSNLFDKANADGLVGGSVTEVLRRIVDGTFDLDANNLLSYVFEILSGNIRTIIPVGILIIVISIVIRILNSFSPAMFKDGMIEIINFVAIGIVVLILSKYIMSVNTIIYNTVASMQSTIDIIFPILLTLMGAVGATSSVAIYSPITSILNTTVSTVISKFLYPLYLISFALIIVSAVSNRIKIGKLSDFVSSLFKTSLAFVFTVFGAVFMIKGISAGKYDSVSIYTTKFAVKNYIPLIGSYISEGFNYIMLSSVIVKNAVGLAGIILILTMILSPVVYLLVLKLMLSLIASLVEMVGNKEVSCIVSKVSKITAFPIAIILGVAFMFIMSISLLLCTANLV